MADELTGPDTTEGDVEVRYVISEGDATPDEEAAGSSPTPDEDPLDRELAKHLNVDQLPADPQEFKQLVEKRYKEVRTGARQEHDGRVQAEQQIEQLKGRLDQLTSMVTGTQKPAAKELPAWAKEYKAPQGASDIEVLADFLEYGIKNTVGTDLAQVNQLKYELGMERVNGMIAQAQQKVGSPEDWEKAEPHIDRALKLGMELDEAVDFGIARAGLIRDKVTREIADRQTAKQNAVGGSITSPGVSRSSSKGPGDPRKVSDSDYWTWAVEEAKREMARQPN